MRGRIEPVFLVDASDRGTAWSAQEADSPAEGCFLVRHQQARMRAALN